MSIFEFFRIASELTVGNYQVAARHLSTIIKVPSSQPQESCQAAAKGSYQTTTKLLPSVLEVVHCHSSCR